MIVVFFCCLAMSFSNPVLHDLDARGFLYQFTDATAIDALFNLSNDAVFYVGFDPTGKSLHVGHLLWIKLVNKLQAAGYKAIVVAGGATGKIGDPTWKDSMRTMLGKDEVCENTNSIVRKLSTLINFESGENPALLLNNDDWISKLNYADFLRDYGPLFSVNKMLAMDSVKSRLDREQHLSFLEFNYMLLQSYDFWHLFDQHNCVLQIGGSDQWSNMISGVDLIRKKTGKQVFGLSTPLLINSDGNKMGKTENGAIWLDEERTSHFEFWQYWRNVDDKDVVKLLKLFSDIAVDEIEQYESCVGTQEMNIAKEILADTVTKFVHKTVDLEAIKQTVSNVFYGAGGNLDGIEEFALDTELSLCDALVFCNLSKSKTLAKNLIAGNGVKIDGEIVQDIWWKINKDCVISVGKKNFAKITFKPAD